MKDLINFLNHKELKALKNVGKTEVIKPSNTVHLKARDKIMSSESYRKMNEQISVGKIIKQINNNNESNTSLL